MGIVVRSLADNIDCKTSRYAQSKSPIIFFMKSASSQQGVSPAQKVIYLAKLFKMRLSGGGSEIGPWKNLEEYRELLAKYREGDCRTLEGNRILEVGYGARPWRLLTLLSMGIDATGIDLDSPTLGASPARLLEVLKQNGVERFAKSLVRGLLFDTRDLRQLDHELRPRGAKLEYDSKRLLVGNAANPDSFEENAFDFVFSEDVFEHIPEDQLRQVSKNISRWLRPGGIALIRPHVYTGIAGGHDPDFYPHNVVKGVSPKDRAWAHLWDTQFAVDTYLNKLRFKDYFSIFEVDFEILEVDTISRMCGEEYLTDELMAKLGTEYSKDELLMNQARFILRAKPR